jgi:hypothetical protein
MLANTNSSTAPENDCPDLEFPIAPDFVSHHRGTSLERILELADSLLPRLLDRPGFWKMRTEGPCPFEFDFDHPERDPATYPRHVIDDFLSYFFRR